MAASPQTVTNNPLYLNARTNVYTANELRRPWDQFSVGPGVADINSFKVVQRVAGANMSVDVTAASVLNRAFVRSTVQTADSVGANADAALYYVDYSSASILNLDISAADPANPRIDQIFLAVEDAQNSGSNNQATVRVVAGTATVGATLDNRTGVGSVPAGMGSILLADVLVPAASATVVTANIRDRRPIGVPGVLGWGGAFFSQIDQQPCISAGGMAPTFVPASAAASSSGWLAGTTDNRQFFYPFFLPRRMTGVTRIRWHYAQGGTAAATNYNIGVYDASLRQIVTTGATAFAGALNTQQARAEVIASTTFEAGLYVIGIGIAAMTAASTVGYYGYPWTTAVAGGAGNVPTASPNQGYHSAAGGTTLPTTLSGLTDLNALAAATTAVGVPQFVLANG